MPEIIYLCGRCGVILTVAERRLQLNTCTVNGSPPRPHAPVLSRYVGGK